jgi:pimeloyl-ACP methyl ester carboxylesterase
VDGVPIVFLHGSMVAGWMWKGQVADLPDYRCLLPDLPGIGSSAEESWTSFADTSDGIAELIETRCTGRSAHLVGLSLGGITGLHVVARHPELVRSLIVSGVPYGRLPSALRLLSTVMIGLYRRPWGARLVARLFGIPDDESMDAFMQTARQTDPASLQALTREVSRTPLPQGLEAVTVPTLAVVGEKDTAPARQAVPYLRGVMPNAVGCIVPEVGHQWNAENQELFSDMIRQWITLQAVNDQLIEV